MARKLILIFKNVLRLKLCYTVWCFTFIGIFLLFLFSSKEYKSEHAHLKSPHTLCLIVPFRDRFEELLEFVPHISKFLNRQSINFRINIINQVDHNRFNRGSLINAGFLIISKKYSDCDYLAMHDVDLLPLNEHISYSYPGNDVFHVSSPELHPRYHYKTFIGGILLISNSQFTRVNGLSNKYWGWGLEDDEFFLRLKEKFVKIYRPSNLSTNQTNTFKHIHGPTRKRDMQRCFNQKSESLRRDRKTGLQDVNYKILSMHSLTIDEFPFTLFNVNLICDHAFTPWCICRESKPQSKEASLPSAKL